MADYDDYDAIAISSDTGEEDLSRDDRSVTEAGSPATPSSRQSRARARTSTSTQPQTDVSQEAKFKALAQTLELLESPEELRLRYAPQCSSTAASADSNSVQESKVLQELIALDGSGFKHADEFGEFNLKHFYVYRSADHPSGHRGKYESLHIVSRELRKGGWLFDGVLENHGIERRITGAEITSVSVGGYGDSNWSSSDREIWIQTPESESQTYWYRLTSPSPEYSKYWEDFVWLANFTRSVFEYLKVQSHVGILVQLLHFRAAFWVWLSGTHAEHLSKWHEYCGARTDFRHDILMYRQFLYDQAYDVYQSWNGDVPELEHPFWLEIGDPGESQGSPPADSAVKTIVTSHVAAVFSKFKLWKEFDLLETLPMCQDVKDYRSSRMLQWGLSEKYKFKPEDTFVQVGRQRIARAARILEDVDDEDQLVGGSALDLFQKVLIVRYQDTFRYVWVRHIERNRLYVVWLVLPSDTICASTTEKTTYPFGNELFYSDTCNCDPIKLTDVIQVVNASVNKIPENGLELFVISMYRATDKSFVTPVLSTLKCCCKTPQHSQLLGSTLGSRISVRRSSQNTYRDMNVGDLFSGCGLLGSAFASSGHTRTALAVEFWKTAALSHRANHGTSSPCKIQSVNDVLKSYLLGEMPLPKLDCIIGGCPCTGFSLLNERKGSRNAESNCSLLANMLAWVDTFLPTYVLVENVPTMDQTPKQANLRRPDPSPNYCAQAISFLVSLGYQVRRSVHIDSEMGGASRRKRLFIVAAAPGAELPAALMPTHGEKGSGIKERTVRDAIRDLDDLHNDTVINVARPLHIPLSRLGIDYGEGMNFRSILERIPEKSSLSKAYYAGLLLPHEQEYFEALSGYKQRLGSKTLTRIDPHRPARTVATWIAPMDAKFSGEIIHPYQNRCSSLEEARRFQGVPDWFVLVGTIRDQYKQLGNAVPWALGAAWGRSFVDAWLKTMERRKDTSSDNNKFEELDDIDSSTTTPTQESASSSHNSNSSSSTMSRPRMRRVIEDDSDSNEEANQLSQETEAVTKRMSSVTLKKDPYAMETSMPVRNPASAQPVVDLTGDSDASEPARALPCRTRSSRYRTRSVVRQQQTTSRVTFQGQQSPLSSSRKRQAPEAWSPYDEDDIKAQMAAEHESDDEPVFLSSRVVPTPKKQKTSPRGVKIEKGSAPERVSEEMEWD